MTTEISYRKLIAYLTEVAQSKYQPNAQPARVIQDGNVEPKNKIVIT